MQSQLLDTRLFMRVPCDAQAKRPYLISSDDGQGVRLRKIRKLKRRRFDDLEGSIHFRLFDFWYRAALIWNCRCEVVEAVKQFYVQKVTGRRLDLDAELLWDKMQAPE